jgi:hypothetical protein
MGTRNNQNEYNLQQTSNDKEYIYIYPIVLQTASGARPAVVAYIAHIAQLNHWFFCCCCFLLFALYLLWAAQQQMMRERRALSVYTFYSFSLLYFRRRRRHNRLFFILFAAGRPMLRVWLVQSRLYNPILYYNTTPRPFFDLLFASNSAAADIPRVCIIYI